MKIRIQWLLPFIIFAFMSCEENDKLNKGAGKIEVAASIDLEVEVSTRAISNAMYVEIDSCMLSIVKSDGTSAPFIGKFADYSNEMEIGVGTYDVTLEYGSYTDEGYNLPYYYATEQVTVADQQTTSLNLDAKLKNAMVALQCTDAFDTYFRSYEVTLQSDGSPVVWSAGETRAAYMHPGPISMSMKLSTITGKELNINAATINAAEGTLYNVVLDVNNGEVGKASISVSFDDATVQRPINIEINNDKDIVDADPPMIQVVGFESGKTIDVIEGEGADVSPEFHIIANAGIEEVWLTTTGNYLLGQGMPNKVNLAGELAPETVGILNALGLKTKGLLTGKDKMAVVDLSGLVQSLRANSDGAASTFSLRVLDKNGKSYPEEGTPEPKLVVDAEALRFDITDAETIAVGETETSFVITTNGKGDELANNLEITAYNTDGLRNPVTITNLEPVQGSEEAYRVTIELPLRNADPGIECTYRGGAIVPKTSISMEYSEAKTSLMEVMTTQNRAIVQIGNTDIMRLARAIYVNDMEISVGASMRNDATGEILIDENAGMKPGNTYEVSVSFLANPSPDNAPWVNVTTEVAAIVPNGDFEELTTGISRTNMDQGGKYTHIYTPNAKQMQNHQTFTIRKPTGWNTTNSITASSDAKTQNSWFVVPSVFNTSLTWTSIIDKDGLQGGQEGKPYSNLPHSDKNAMVIRNVAYDHNGIVPSLDKDTKLSDNFYSTHAPATIANRMAGRLALGTDGNGADFHGTPKALNLWYIYKEDSHDPGERGTVEIQLVSHDEDTGKDIVVATGSATLPARDNADDFTQVSVPITYSDFWKRPSTLKIVIRSSNRKDENIKVTNHISLHEQSAYGAQLIVDNLTFEY